MSVPDIVGGEFGSVIAEGGVEYFSVLVQEIDVGVPKGIPEAEFP